MSSSIDRLTSTIASRIDIEAPLAVDVERIYQSLSTGERADAARRLIEQVAQRRRRDLVRKREREAWNACRTDRERAFARAVEEAESNNRQRAKDEAEEDERLHGDRARRLGFPNAAKFKEAMRLGLLSHREIIDLEVDAQTEHLRRALAFADKLIHDTFSLGNGVEVTWGDATREDHEARIAFLQTKVDGIEATIALHREAVDILACTGVATIGEARRRALGLQDAITIMGSKR